MEDKSQDIYLVIKRLKDELSSHVECMDEETTIDCDIQRLIDAYDKVSTAWIRMCEVNDLNMAHIKDLKQEITILNCELDELRNCVD